MYAVTVVKLLALAGCVNSYRTPLFVEAISYMTPEEASMCFDSCLSRFWRRYEAAKPVRTLAEAEVVFQEFVGILSDEKTPRPSPGRPSANTKWSSVRENSYCFFTFRENDPEGLLIILKGGKSVLRAPYAHTGVSLKHSAPLVDKSPKEEYPALVAFFDELGADDHDSLMKSVDGLGHPVGVKGNVNSWGQAERVFESLSVDAAKVRPSQAGTGLRAINRYEWSMVKTSDRCYYIERKQGLYDVYIIVEDTDKVISARQAGWGSRRYKPRRKARGRGGIGVSP